MMDDATPTAIYQMAAYRLAIFADQPAVNILPETYAPGSPLILHAQLPWLAVYMRDWLLAGVPEDDLRYWLPGADPALAYLPQPPRHVFGEWPALADALPTGEAAPEQLWLLTTPDQRESAAGALIFETLDRAGYASTPYPIQHERYRLAQFSVWRFQRRPADLDVPQVQFGQEDIQLLTWRVVGEPRACRNLRLQSWWRSTQVPQHNYSLTAVLANAEGQPVSQRDAAIGETLMQLWQPDQLVFDERVVPLPCQPGRYDLLLGLYWDDGGQLRDLEALSAAGEVLGTRFYLTSVAVEAAP
ncbi:MAG: hypothetical protein HC915_06000 [Anaerolineae bacterium]|nr:hypothetical protein [Anaerolineae bacterium]